MDIHRTLKEQYHAGLAMLDECVNECTDELWRAGDHPRTFWRIAWHSLYFTHIYLGQNEESFNNSVADWPPTI